MTSDLEKFIQENNDRYTFGQRIETIMMSKNMTKKDLVNASNVNEDSLGKYLSGSRSFAQKLKF